MEAKLVDDDLDADERKFYTSKIARLEIEFNQEIAELDAAQDLLTHMNTVGVIRKRDVFILDKMKKLYSDTNLVQESYKDDESEKDAIIVKLKQENNKLK